MSSLEIYWKKLKPCGKPLVKKFQLLLTGTNKLFPELQSWILWNFSIRTYSGMIWVKGYKKPKVPLVTHVTCMNLAKGFRFCEILFFTLFRLGVRLWFYVPAYTSNLLGELVAIVTTNRLQNWPIPHKRGILVWFWHCCQSWRTPQPLAISFALHTRKCERYPCRARDNQSYQTH